MDNWNFTGKPDVPAWPRDAQGQDEKAVLLTQTYIAATVAATTRASQAQGGAA